MTSTVADIVVSLRADAAPFDRGLRQASGSMRGFEGRVGSMGAALSRLGPIAAAAAVAFVAAGAALGRSAAAAAVEIDNLARISSTTPREFQRMAAAADTVRISQEKLADIFRDVQDRVGDFIQTGGGPMTDFFENIAPLVGVTADQFARLSGPDALQLYVSSLERANLTQADMVFYLEAMASDSSDLLPLLRDNGAAMREIGDAAERTGRIMSDGAIANGTELDRVFRDLSSTMRTTFGEAILENSEDIIELAETLQEILPGAIAVAVTALELILAPIRAIAAAIGLVGEAIDGVRVAGQLAAQGMTDARTDNSYRTGQTRTDGTGFEMNDPRGDQVYSGAVNQYSTPGVNAPFQLPEITFASMSPGAHDVRPTPRPAQGASGGGGGGGGQDWRGQFEAMQDQFASEQELIQENYTRQLEMLEEFRAQRVGTEEEYNELERRINADHADQMRQQEQAAMQARLQMVSGTLGSLASIIESSGARNLAVVRGLRTAEAVIDGYAAATAAWRQGMTQGGPVLATAYTAASLARTGALIGQIQSSGKGSTGGGGGSAGVAAPAEAAQPLQVYMRGLDPSALFTGAAIGGILDGLMEEAGDRGLSITRAVS